MKDKVRIESETIKKLSAEDVKLTTEVYYGLQFFIGDNRDFYITVFKNKENRKIVLKVSGGLLKQATIDKIDKREL